MLDARVVLQQLGYLAPEALLTVVVLALIGVDIAVRRNVRVLGLLALLGTLAVLGVLFRAWSAYPHNLFYPDAPVAETAIFGGSAMYDRFGLFFKILFLVAAGMAVLFTQPVVSRWPRGQGETYVLMLSCTLGMMFMASANDLLMMYLSLEFVSVTSYIMAGLRQRNQRSAEASLKYIIYGAAASGMMLYGITFLYGLTGSLQVDAIGAKLVELQGEGAGVPQTMSLVISVLVMAGFGYKIAAAPFHMWCPDVYEGAPTPITAFFSVGPKAAGFAMLVRFLAGVYQTGGGEQVPFDWNLIVALLAVLTMAVGNFGALQQQNLKRLMAYSSIGHSGYVLLAFVAFGPENVASAMFYLVVYVIMNVGAFVVVIVLEERFGIETVDDCRGLGWRAPVLCALMTLFMLSLTGLPPTAGFVGKLFLFGELIQAGGALNITLVVAGVMFSVISLYYYARVIGAMFLFRAREGEEGVACPAIPLAFQALLWLTAFGTLWYGIFPEGLFRATKEVVVQGILPKI
ncbi:MAG: NADH-quinone oxidoreductase subunit N [Planctomycetes bacterium]|nr:NADH-quinone oxidoreductase subunit N [Planctomycetota bacterium]